ncbi:MAG TPA: hypothetical protein VFM34_00170 [Moraxellaceae bacterium]|nr:hypothetical protein [Moraxellaceae bacterium]
MSLHYGTKLTQHPSLEAAAEAAIARHSHYHTDVAGWLLRAEAVSYAVSDEYGDYVSSRPGIELFAFPVVRWTPCGATILPIWGHRTRSWVRLDNPGNQWASRTAREAIRQLMLRRKRQQYILQRQLARAKEEEHLASCAINWRDVEPVPLGA